MIFKLRQQLEKQNRTTQNRTPNFRSKKFMINWLRRRRRLAPSFYARGAMGFLQWLLAVKYHPENRIAYRASCFITGRSRGVSKRFGVARTKVKTFVDAAQLFGVQKSSF